MNRYTFTVFTPVYNRRDTMRRAFESLKKQTNMDFEWLIIDDGSSDGLGDDVDDYIREADFPVRYFWKENGGKASAINYAYSLAQGTYFVTLDSDDELTERALEIFISVWNSIAERDKENYWSICSLCRDAQLNTTIGNRFPPNINSLSGIKQKKALAHTYGERMGCQKLEILRQFPFPQYKDTKFVPEGMIWKMIDKSYQQYYVNEVCLSVHKSTDSITQTFQSKSKDKYASSYYYAKFIVNEYYEMLLYNPKFYLKKAIDLYRSGFGSGRSFKEINSEIISPALKIILFILLPISVAILHKDKKGKA